MLPNPKTTPLVRGTAPEIQQAARELRWQRQTAAEAALWEVLKGKQLAGLKFRRQHAVGPFILDFWCPVAKVAVELDGGIHADPDQATHDAARTEQLAAYGYQVVRFRNEEVLENLDSVLQRIREACVR